MGAVGRGRERPPLLPGRRPDALRGLGGREAGEEATGEARGVPTSGSGVRELPPRAARILGACETRRLAFRSDGSTVLENEGGRYLGTQRGPRLDPKVTRKPATGPLSLASGGPQLRHLKGRAARQQPREEPRAFSPCAAAEPAVLAPGKQSFKSVLMSAMLFFLMFRFCIASPSLLPIANAKDKHQASLSKLQLIRAEADKIQINKDFSFLRFSEWKVNARHPHSSCTRRGLTASLRGQNLRPAQRLVPS